MQERELKPCPECGGQRVPASVLGNAAVGVMPGNPPTIRDVLINNPPAGTSK
ncbi:hypothetical protein [Dictyobacter vulcani]|uniref:hypothetical protein n=1 Tax=Dictyobacter vulcani TaxID=2607529 RepID=UPI001386F12B|nr:hypothetical protein [Dictyobacter vulcani]